ncbi:MAG: hypothetical protein L0220_34820 [Acidobacteria bacterium]|nr:hypothetical protein [Acidobacteriota bacterium]
MEKKKIAFAIILGIILCTIAGGFWLLKSKSEIRIITGQEASLGYGIDPHLFLTLESIGLQDKDTANPMFSMRIHAKNTAARVKFNLADLQFELQEGDRAGSRYEITNWTTENGELLVGNILLPEQEAKGELWVLLPAKYDLSGVIIWKEEDWYKRVPFVRKTVLNHRLRIEMSELLKTQATVAPKEPR